MSRLPDVLRRSASLRSGSPLHFKALFSIAAGSCCAALSCAPCAAAAQCESIQGSHGIHAAVGAGRRKLRQPSALHGIVVDYSRADAVRGDASRSFVSHCKDDYFRKRSGAGRVCAI